LVALPASQEQLGVSAEDLLFPKFDYHLDESDPDIAVLCRQDGTFVAAFSVRGATREGIVEAAKEDYGELLRVHRAHQARHAQEHESA
jgi:hypothetical protein